MDTATEVRIIITAVDVLDTQGLADLFGVVEHILAHLQFVFLQFTVHGKHVHAPFVLFGLVEGNLIPVIRQGLAKAAHVAQVAPPPSSEIKAAPASIRGARRL